MNHILATQLQQWFETKTGQAIFHCEQEKIAPTAQQTFGYLAVQLGLPSCNYLDISPIQKKIIVSSFSENTQDYPCVQASLDSLPFKEQSVDLIILPHTLELVNDPIAVLKEAYRVLINEGILIVLGFNPLHLWGVRALYREKETVPIPLKNQIPQRKLRDWVKLAGFELEKGCFSRTTPLQRWHFLQKNAWFAKEGSIYFLQARKRVAGLRLVGPALSKAQKSSQQIPVLTSSSLKEKTISSKHSS